MDFLLPCLPKGNIQYSIHIPLPSGKRLHIYGKSSFGICKSTISTAIFNSYVSLPEGDIPFVF